MDATLHIIIVGRMPALQISTSIRASPASHPAANASTLERSETSSVADEMIRRRSFRFFWIFCKKVYLESRDRHVQKSVFTKCFGELPGNFVQTLLRSPLTGQRVSDRRYATQFSYFILPFFSGKPLGLEIIKVSRFNAGVYKNDSGSFFFGGQFRR